MNNINLIGRITADVELKTTQNGVEVCTFTLAVKRPKVNNTTDFINCVAWRETAKFIKQYFQKGQMMAVNGTLTSRKWQDNNNNNNRVAFEVVVDSVYFCQGKSKDKPEVPQSEAPSLDAPNFEEFHIDDHLPF